MKKAIFVFVLLFVSIITSIDPALSKLTICRLPGLEGFEAQARIAKSVLPPTTSNVDELAVYITSDTHLGRDGFYYHSNFKTDPESAPTKVGGDIPELKSDVQLVMRNIVGVDLLTEKGIMHSAFQELFEEKTTVYLDTNMINKDGSIKIDLGNAKNVRIVDARAARSLSSTGESINTKGSPPPLLITRLKGCCLFGRAQARDSNALRMLTEAKIDGPKIKLLNLARDGAAARLVKEKPSLSKSNINLDITKITKIGDIDNIFRRNRGETIFLVGHSEGANFVIRDGTDVQLSVPVKEVHASAQAHGIKLIDVSCKTARTLADEVPFGVVGKFQATEAIERFAHAREGSGNLGEFLEKMASENIKIVFNGGSVAEKGFFWTSTSIEGEIMAKAKKGFYATIAYISINW